MYKSGHYLIKISPSSPAVPKWMVNINGDLYIFKAEAGKCGQWQQIMEWDVKSDRLETYN